jgi:EpsI family protein
MTPAEVALRPDRDVAVSRPDRRQLLLGGGMLLATGAALGLQPRRMVQRLAPNTLERAVPTTIGGWRFLTASGLVLPPQDEMTLQLYDQVLTRVYTSDGLPPVMLLIAYGSAQDYTLQAHLPEVCYPSSGYTVSRIERVGVALKPGVSSLATFLTAEKPDRVEQVFYWLRIGQRFPATLSQERMAVIEANLRGVLPDGVLVRLSTIGDSRAAALAELGRFNTQLLAALSGEGRSLLIGA